MSFRLRGAKRLYPPAYPQPNTFGFRASQVLLFGLTAGLYLAGVILQFPESADTAMVGTSLVLAGSGTLVLAYLRGFLHNERVGFVHTSTEAAAFERLHGPFLHGHWARMEVGVLSGALVVAGILVVAASILVVIGPATQQTGGALAIAGSLLICVISVHKWLRSLWAFRDPRLMYRHVCYASQYCAREGITLLGTSLGALLFVTGVIILLASVSRPVGLSVLVAAAACFTLSTLSAAVGLLLPAPVLDPSFESN
jgi:hypothetical protein